MSKLVDPNWCMSSDTYFSQAAARMRSLSTKFQLAFLLLILAACTSRDLEEGDRDLVLKIEQLQPYGLSIPPNFSDFESFKREQWIDGSVTIEYEFEAPDQLGLRHLG